MPEDDIGKRYFSSSSDIEFINHQKNYPEQYKYDILSIHDTRKDAFIEEERLHTLYNVAFNTEYKNKCKCQVGENMRFNMTTVYDENKNKIWYSFLFEPKAKLTKLKKSQIQDQLKFVSIDKQNDETLESLHEVSEKVFFEFLELCTCNGFCFMCFSESYK